MGVKKPIKDNVKFELLVSTVQQLSLAKNINEVTKIIRTVARKMVQSDGATFVLNDNGYCYYADEDAISPLWKGRRFPIKNCISGWAMLNKKSVVIPDIYVDARIPIEAYRPTFVKSLAMIPIRKLKPIGAIGVYWAKKRKPTTEEINLIQSLADITAVSIENIEIREKLQLKLKEQKKLVKQLIGQKNQLEEFTHIVAHNLRSPLTNLLLLNDMIRESKDMEEKLIFLDKQKTVVEILNETYDELVNITNVRSDYAVQKEHLEYEEVFDRVIKLLEGEILVTGTTIKKDFSESPNVFFSRTYLDSIFINLLSNAIKYKSPDRKPTIEIKSYRSKGWNCLEVKDNGLGIDLKKHGNEIFKLRKTFHNNPNAKGFGLFITRTHLEVLGGEIKVKSQPGKGTTFILKLNKFR